MLKMDYNLSWLQQEQTTWLSIHPIEEKNESRWIGLNDKKEIAEINLTKKTVNVLFSLDFTNLDWTESICMMVSERREFAVVANTRGKYGVVVDLLNRQTTMDLNRGDYETGNTHSNFSLAFFSKNGEELLIHATDWNRLDVSNPKTGTSLTDRISPKTSEEHYLDYFHAGLHVSPDQNRVIDNGWHWHPYAVLNTWDLNEWLDTNVWASNNSKSNLPGIEDVGDRPFCWIDNQTFALWGMQDLEGEEGDRHSEFYLDLGIYDISTGEMEKKIIGCPYGSLLFDEVLFSISEETGTIAFDIDSGEEIFQDEHHKPLSYSKERKEFLSILSDGSFQTGTLYEDS